MDLPRLGDRSLFPDLGARAYLAHAALSPASLPVRRALLAAVTDTARRGAAYFPDSLAQRERLRRKLAQLLHAEEGEVALTMNTSQGVTDVALCLPWQPGDRVVCLTGEFPANVTPWQRAAALFGLKLTFVDADRFRTDPTRAWEDLDRATGGGVRLLAASAVQFQTGMRMPLRALGEHVHARGGELFVDAIQALGGTPLDVRAEGIDYLASGSHKFLMGVEGVGVVYARRACARALRPHTAGWLGHPDPFDFLSRGAGLLRHDKPLRDDALLFEQGTFNAVGCAALEAAVDLLLALGVDAVHAHVNALLDPLEQGLTARGFASVRAAAQGDRSCILSARPPRGEVLAWAKALAERGVVVSTPDGYLRFAPHWPNGAGEVPVVLGALDEVARAMP
ncbi:MAG: aminotransferase class V-fold PLP-dependent enzyme [Polyangiales bacterium]